MVQVKEKSFKENQNFYTKKRHTEYINLYDLNKSIFLKVHLSFYFLFY